MKTIHDVLAYQNQKEEKAKPNRKRSNSRLVRTTLRQTYSSRQRLAKTTVVIQTDRCPSGN